MLLVIIPSIAIATSILIFLAILSGLRAMWELRLRYLLLCARWVDPIVPPIHGHRALRIMGQAAPVLLPVIFMAVWIFLLVRRLF